ncbi:cystathionine beta-lyase [Paracoccus sp. Z330]|uniref:Cystathionine beta-lyase n=1 Tax=Paracoccus onchidii TaxID=3017813 RepID=A0ABT4ZCF6_9RHOB|nr:cystathionine beta-lyase [Paracoccus onchidii]MDB6176401.1 cystathionine beta-lyase [Paracoccus onchidii]
MTDRPLFSDALVHLGRGVQANGRPVNLPISQGSTMLFNSLAEFEAARDARHQHGTLYYGRYGTPASFELEAAMTALEGGAGCVSVSAGLTAVTLALMGAARSGDHLLVADNVYMPTRNFCDNVLARYGVEVTYFDSMQDISPLLQSNTSAVMFEAPGSGTFEVPDIRAISATARAHGALAIIDGTWATPIFCRPLSLGADVVVHSGSKYIGGHADSMIGFIVCNEATYPRMRQMALAFGDKPGSQDVFLSLRGLRTLEMRMKAAESSGLQVARWLAEQPQVLKVLHPAFPECPGHDTWKRDFEGSAGLFSIVVRDCSTDRLHAFVDALDLFGIGVSWGGFESLILPVRPLRTATRWDEAGHLVRLNIGFENPDSLCADLARALPLLD